jgi:choline kinase
VASRRAIVVASYDPRAGHAGAATSSFAVDVAGRTLVECQVAALEDAGVSHVTIVAPGVVPDVLRQRFAGRAHVLDDDAGTWPGGLHALLRARDALASGALIVHGASVFTGRLVEHVAQHPAPDVLVYAPGHPEKDTAARVRLAGPYVIDVGRHVVGADVAGESVGLVKLGPEGARRLVSLLHVLAEDADADAPAWQALARLARTWPIVALDTGGHSWARLDTPDDAAHPGPFARRAGSAPAAVSAQRS